MRAKDPAQDRRASVATAHLWATHAHKGAGKPTHVLAMHAHEGAGQTCSVFFSLSQNLKVPVLTIEQIASPCMAQVHTPAPLQAAYISLRSWQVDLTSELYFKYDA